MLGNHIAVAALLVTPFLDKAFKSVSREIRCQCIKGIRWLLWLLHNLSWGCRVHYALEGETDDFWTSSDYSLLLIFS